MFVDAIVPLFHDSYGNSALSPLYRHIGRCGSPTRVPLPPVADGPLFPHTQSPQQNRHRPTTTAAHHPSGQIRGANRRERVYYPHPTARKRKENPPSTSIALDCHKIVTRFCGLSRLGCHQCPRNEIDGSWANASIWHGCRMVVTVPLLVLVQPAVQCAYTRATRRHSRDPAPCARNTFATFSPFVYWTELLRYRHATCLRRVRMLARNCITDDKT